MASSRENQLRQLARLRRQAMEAKDGVRADTVIVDDEGKTIETHTSFLQAILRRAALLRKGESPRLYYVRDDGIWRVIFPYGDYAGWSFRKVKEIRGSK